MSDETVLAATLTDFLGSKDFLYLGFWLLAAGASYVVVRLCLVRLVNRAMERTRTKWDDILANRGVFSHLAFLAPALILYFGAAHFPAISQVARQIILAYVFVNVIIILDRLLSAGLDIYRLYPVSKTRPIKGYVQLAKLVLYFLGAVTAISVLLGRSPWEFLVGMGAMTAILLLVFRDTILSLIASIQLVADDLVDHGDWIEMPECGADGEVIDIALHTVKVRNWDNTIVTVPTYKLIDGSFKNWRVMRETGGRRIKRSLLIDQTSVRICDDELLERFWRIDRLKPYLEAKGKELGRANSLLDSGDGERHPLNRRALTNLGTFRAYVTAYLLENAKLRKDMTFMVRQRPPSPDGLPLEIYVFSTETNLVDYESVQSDIFDHLLASVPYFDLRVFQYPTGRDLQTLMGRSQVEPAALPGLLDALPNAGSAAMPGDGRKPTE